MEKSGRNYLNGSVRLSRYPNGAMPEEYTVKSVIGEGGSSVCYEAVRTLSDGTVETGKLKEFYPTDSPMSGHAPYYSLERLADGQLVPCAGTIRKFDKMCVDYLDSYRLLRSVIADNPDNEILKRYIQHGEILYGCPADDGDSRTPTVYIWSPGIAGKGFDIYLSEIRKSPFKRPEDKLKNILNIIDTLTDSVKALHTAGLMHLDIKPSNFLVPYNSDFEVNTDNVSLFDINTLCFANSKFIHAYGTKGYCAPEVIMGKPDNRSDIYSIGAMLFYAVVINDDLPDGLYRDFLYPSIAQLVKSSKLFSNSETNSDTVLMSGMCRILEKCLAPSPRARYQSCSELKADLKKVKTRLAKMLMTPAEKPKDGISDPTVVMQKLLYEHPVYESVPENQTDINVLLIGSGTYGQKFIDICLQAGQMYNTSISITAVSDDPKEGLESYLKFRPAMGEFVNINGSLAGSENNAYASLDFAEISDFVTDIDENPRFTASPSTINDGITEAIIAKEKSGRGYSYVFVALGNDKLSASVAASCAKQLGYSCPVAYISYKIKKPTKKDLKNKLYAVCVNEAVDIGSVDNRLMEMAFNTHISWSSSLNMDITAERESFSGGSDEKNRYRRSSSLAYAISLKYKLHSIGIDCDDPYLAAKRFNDEILSPMDTDSAAREKFDRLVCLEHRRWVLDRASQGWRAPRDENGSLSLDRCIAIGSVKDERNKTHPCMVNSTATSPLSGDGYNSGNRLKWEYGDIDPKLDDLDAMSVTLHRCFKKHADMLRSDTAQLDSDLDLVRSLVPDDSTEAVTAFKQLSFAVKNILGGVESYSLQYDSYENSLTSAISQLAEDIQRRIKERLALVKHALYPVIESNIYRNYKAIDETLVRKIPFILTHRYSPSLALAFDDGRYVNGRNEAIFADVASATVLSPEKICYLYCYGKDSSAQLLVNKLDAVLNYLGKRKVHCGIEFVSCCLNEVSNKELNLYTEKLNELKELYPKGRYNAWFEGATVLPVDSVDKAVAEFASYINRKNIHLYDGSTRLFQSEYENAMFISSLITDQMPYFEFDWREKVFTKHIDCEYLRYIKDSSFIRINDMFALMNAADNKFNMPEMGDDYLQLWSIYTGEYLKNNKFSNGVTNWTRLCNSLKCYEEEQKPLAKITLNQNPNATVRTITKFLPGYCYPTVKMVLGKLIEYGVVHADSTLASHTSDTCRLEISLNSEFYRQVNGIFDNPQYLLPYYGVNVRRSKGYSSVFVEVVYNNLRVANANLDHDGSGHHEISFTVLKMLEEANFISGLERSSDTGRLASFTYSSPRIKKLLTSPGEILELYAYYEAVKTGYFDDVACNYEFRWAFGDVRNELDLVLTKGFKSIIVECKSVAELKLDFYHKLHSIADQFGIGTTKVLLGNTYNKTNAFANEVNDMQRSRGDQLNIVTISGEKQIKNIGETLISLMKKS